MKFLLLFFSPMAFAVNCNIVDVHTLSNAYAYPAPCKQSAFSGAWGDPTKFQHMLDADLQNAMASALAAQASADTAKKARTQALQTACANPPAGPLAAICAKLLNDLN